MAKIKQNPKVSVLVYFHSGGHATQMIKLVELLGDKYSYSYVIPTFNTITEKKLKIKGKIIKITSASYLGNSALHNAFTTIICIFQSLAILLKIRPKAIISCGPSTGIFISILGKLMGSKIIFVESWSRVTRFSSAGGIMYNFADQFFVQWEELKEKYPKTIYAGRLG